MDINLLLLQQAIKNAKTNDEYLHWHHILIKYRADLKAQLIDIELLFHSIPPLGSNNTSSKDE